MVVSPKLNKTFDGTDPPPKKASFFCCGRGCLEARSTRIWVCLGPNQNLPEETKVNMYWGDGLKYRLITIIGSYFLDNVTQNCDSNFSCHRHRKKKKILVTVTVTVKKFRQRHRNRGAVTLTTFFSPSVTCHR